MIHHDSKNSPTVSLILLSHAMPWRSRSRPRVLHIAALSALVAPAFVGPPCRASVIRRATEVKAQLWDRRDPFEFMASSLVLCVDIADGFVWFCGWGR